MSGWAEDKGLGVFGVEVIVEGPPGRATGWAGEGLRGGTLEPSLY